MLAAAVNAECEGSQQAAASTSRSSDEVLMAFWALIQATNQHLKPALEEAPGLPLRLMVMLYHIKRGAVHPGRLTERMGLTPSAVTRAVEELVQRGLLSRELDPQDSRRIRLVINPPGEAALLKVRDTALEVWQAGLDGVDEAEVATLLALVRRIGDNMGRLGKRAASEAP